MSLPDRTPFTVDSFRRRHLSHLSDEQLKQRAAQSPVNPPPGSEDELVLDAVLAEWSLRMRVAQAAEMTDHI